MRAIGVARRPYDVVGFGINALDVIALAELLEARGRPEIARALG